MNFYAYCLSDEVTTAALESLQGVQGAAARLIDYKSIRAVVSHFDGERAEVTRENAFLHDAVIRQVLKQTTPLPFRFGAVVSDRELEAYITKHGDELFSQLARVRGAVEMSVKILWNAEAIKQAGVEMAERLRDKNRDEAMGPGASFLQSKRRDIIGDKALKSRAEELAAWLGERLGATVRESVARVLPSPAMAVAVSHLVERARLGQYNERLATARKERGELRFLTSGVWPPYSFCNLDS
jgi:hypothetical protein